VSAFVTEMPRVGEVHTLAVSSEGDAIMCCHDEANECEHALEFPAAFNRPAEPETHDEFVERVRERADKVLKARFN
jgi:hypothetical protein